MKSKLVLIGFTLVVIACLIVAILVIKKSNKQNNDSIVSTEVTEEVNESKEIKATGKYGVKEHIPELSSEEYEEAEKRYESLPLHNWQ